MTSWNVCIQVFNFSQQYFVVLVYVTHTVFFLINWKADSKIYMEMQKTQNWKNNFKKEEQIWRGNITWFQDLL